VAPPSERMSLKSPYWPLLACLPLPLDQYEEGGGEASGNGAAHALQVARPTGASSGGKNDRPGFNRGGGRVGGMEDDRTANMATISTVLPLVPTQRNLPTAIGNTA